MGGGGGGERGGSLVTGKSADLRSCKILQGWAREVSLQRGVNTARNHRGGQWAERVAL